jgi:hypothetical protein
MIIKMHITTTIKPRRGEIDATPSGLGYRFLTHCYNPNTPSGLKNGNNLFCYILGTPSGLGYGFLTHCYNLNTPSGLKNGNNLFCYILATPSGLNTLQKAFAGELSFGKSRRDENIVENMIEQQTNPEEMK